MKQIKLLGVLAIALTLGLASCNGGGNGGGGEGGESQAGGTSVCEKHQWGPKETIKEPTCTEDGLSQRTCTVCGAKEDPKPIKASHTWGQWVTIEESTCIKAGKQERECSVCHVKEEKDLALADHTYAKDAEGNDVVEWTSRATCENPGAGTKTCTVEGCGHVENVTENALGHEYAKDAEGNDIVTWTREADCTKGGIGTKTCTREGCGHVENVETDPLGHDTVLIGGEVQPAQGEAAVRLYECQRCKEQFLGFKADEPSEASLPHLMKGDHDGMRFFGRPIGNAMALDANGTSVNQQNIECVYCSTETGDFFEYIFTLNKAQAETLATCRLYCDARPADHLSGDFWAYGRSATDWTPGYYIDGADAHVQHNEDGSVMMVKDHARAVSVSAEDRSQPEGAELETEVPMGARIEDYRYVLYVDDKIQEFDADTKVAPQGSGTNMVRAEYVLPYTFHLHEGQNKISLRMAGGYRSEFYNFIFRPYVEPTPITVNEAKLEVREGKTAAITSSMEGLTYKSSNNQICTVDDKGVVTGVKAGTATITVSKEGNYKDAKVEVTVLEKEGIITLDLADGVVAPEGGFAAYHSSSSGDWLRNPQKDATLSFTFQSEVAGKFDVQMGLRGTNIKVEETIGVKVNDVDVAAAGTVNGGYNVVDLVVGQADLKVGENTLVVTALANSELYLKTIKLVPHVHAWGDKEEVAASGNGVAYDKYVCTACGATKIEVKLVDSMLAEGSVNKNDPAGYMKLKSNGQCFSFKFNFDKAGSAKIFQRGVMDSFSANGKRNVFSGGSNGADDFELTVNGAKVDLSSYKSKTYNDLMGTEAAVGTNNLSPVTDVESGVISLVAGENTVTYKRLASYNLALTHIVFIVE